MKSKLSLLVRLALNSLARNQLLLSISLRHPNLILAPIPRSRCLPPPLYSLKLMLLRLTLIQPTTTTMEVIVSLTMVVEVVTISLPVAAVIVVAMVMAVGVVVVGSLTFSVKSVINMDMRLPTVIIGMMITMSLLNQ